MNNNIPNNQTTYTTILKQTCNKCGKDYDPNEPDPCLGRLPSVCCACCGHGKNSPYFLIWCDGNETISNTSAFRLSVHGRGEKIKITHERTVWKDHKYVDDIKVDVPSLEFYNYVNLLDNNKKESIQRILSLCGFYKIKMELVIKNFGKIKSTLPLRRYNNPF